MIDIYYSRVACNTYIMFNENDEGFLVDPCFSNNYALIDHVKKLNKNIKAILITHGHCDHIFALEEICDLYPDAKVYICDKECDILTNPKLNLSVDYLDQGKKLITYEPKNLIKVVDNEEFECAGFKIKVIETPFHTHGSVCYYVESEHTLFTGDTLFFTTIGRTDLPTGSERTLEDSLKKLKMLPENIKVYPGHGPITTLDREKKYNSYLKNI